MYIIRNGIIVQPERLVYDHELVVDGDTITAIVPQGETPTDEESGIIDAHGGYVTPGFIDIHSDYIENVASPRPTVLIDFHTALFEAERELLMHGITTMFHSLSVYRRTIFDEKPIRKFENVEKLIALIHRAHLSEGENGHLIRHRLHARLEIDNVDLVAQIEGHLRSGDIDEISFMDHTPGQGQYRDIEVFRRSLQAYRKVTTEEALAIARSQQKAEKLTYEDISYLASIARERNIAIASHDDDSPEKLDLMYALGARISEFPVSLDVARYACGLGMATILGSPNILLGRSQAGNLSAREAVENGVANVLCSDYYPTAMLHSIFRMRSDFGLPLHEAFAKVTINPARVVGIDRTLGSLEVGKKADILLIREIAEEEREYPVITCVLVDGRVVTRSWYPALPSASARFATDASAKQKATATLVAHIVSGEEN